MHGIRDRLKVEFNTRRETRQDQQQDNEDKGIGEDEHNYKDTDRHRHRHRHRHRLRPSISVLSCLGSKCALTRATISFTHLLLWGIVRVRGRGRVRVKIWGLGFDSRGKSLGFGIRFQSGAKVRAGG
jgi:hypothetical protein